MGIGTTSGRQYQRSLSSKLAEPGVVALTLKEAMDLGIAIIQGSPTAVAPIGESDFNLLTPPIPGGLQFEKLVVVTTASPVLLPSTRRYNAIPGYAIAGYALPSVPLTWK